MYRSPPNIDESAIENEPDPRMSFPNSARSVSDTLDPNLVISETDIEFPKEDLPDTEHVSDTTKSEDDKTPARIKSEPTERADARRTKSHIDRFAPISTSPVTLANEPE
jgi:hypothetical protein